MPQKVDYAALVQKHGGTMTVDLDALARKHGGQIQRPPEPAAPQPAGPSLTDRAVDLLPVAGGMAGGIIGGIGGTVGGFGVGGVPGAIGGATLGGGFGEASKQLINRVRGKEAPATMGEAATSIAKEGAIQGVSEVAGAGIAGGAKVVGKALLENAVRPTMTLLDDFPNVMAVIQRERLPVGRFLPFLKSGSQQAGTKRAAATAKLHDLLRKAEAGGKEFTTSDVAKPVLEFIDDISKQPLSQSEMKRLAGMLDEFMTSHPGPLTPLAVKELKQNAQAIAKPIFKAQRKGFPVTPEQPLTARFHEAIATGAKKGLETIDEVAGVEKHTQDLIGAGRALRQAERRRLGLAAEGISGASAVIGGLLQPGSDLPDTVRNATLAWIVARGLGSPRTISRAGLTLTNRQVQQMLREIPRLAVAVGQASGAQGEEVATTSERSGR